MKWSLEALRAVFGLDDAFWIQLLSVFKCEFKCSVESVWLWLVFQSKKRFTEFEWRFEDATLSTGCRSSNCFKWIYHSSSKWVCRNAANPRSRSITSCMRASNCLHGRASLELHALLFLNSHTNRRHTNKTDFHKELDERTSRRVQANESNIN